MNKCKGIGVSPGIAIGKVILLNRSFEMVLKIKLKEEEVEREVERYLGALKRAEEEITLLEQKAKKIFPADISTVFHAHLLMVTDEIFTKKIPEHIRKHKINSEWAVQEKILKIQEQLKATQDQYFQERIQDIQDVAKHILSALQTFDHQVLTALNEESIIVSNELAPSDILLVHHPKIIGFATQEGGETSHTAIMAKAMHIPAVLSAKEIMKYAKNGNMAIIDGNQGVVIFNPDQKLIKEYKKKKEKEEERILKQKQVLEIPDKTKDGIPFKLLSNLELLEELDVVKKNGAKGVGLYRSEFLYIIGYPHIPSEEEHFYAYKKILEAMGDFEVTIRTFDLGGRKFAKETLHFHEGNPVLGMRGIRLCLNAPEIFRPQLKGLLRASLYGNLKIMIPMVCCVDEVIETRKILEELKRELKKEGKKFKENIPLGIMVEVPSCAFILNALEPYVEFFSLGTNDLIQYTLAVDRNNPNVSNIFSPLHPAILKIIKMVADFGKERGKEVSVCGEMAGNPIHAGLLFGLGIRTFSMEPYFIPEVKSLLTSIDSKSLEEIAYKALQMPTVKAVNECLIEEMGKIFPKGLLCQI